MNRDEISRMAREAGIAPQYTRPQDSKVRKGLALSGELTCYRADIQDIERFAALVAAAEREACAKVCEDDVRTWSHPGSITRAECATAIRARGE